MDILLETPKLEEVLKGWKSYGAVSTPGWVVEKMLELAGIKNQAKLSILEPACGFCNFLLAIYQKSPQNNFWGIELNEEVYDKLKNSFPELPFNLLKEDFLLWDTANRFDLIIGNPPYGIIGDASHYPLHPLKEKKKEYKKLFSTWFGKYNIYGAFVERAVNLLTEQGKLVFILPATWLILDEFKKLRAFLAKNGKTRVYYLGKNIFEKISVSVCILILEKGNQGVELFHYKDHKLQKNLEKQNWYGEMLKFETPYTKKVESGKIHLREIFEIRISARSPEVRKFPGILRQEEDFALPFICGRNLKKGEIERKNFTQFWLKREQVTKLKNFYGILPRIVVGHTKGGKVVSAVEEELYPYIGDVYHLLPKTKLDFKQIKGIVDWLNSDELNNYIKTQYQEITPHITATQLKLIPLNIEIDKRQGSLFLNEF